MSTICIKSLYWRKVIIIIAFVPLAPEVATISGQTSTSFLVTVPYKAAASHKIKITTTLAGAAGPTLEADVGIDGPFSFEITPLQADMEYKIKSQLCQGGTCSANSPEATGRTRPVGKFSILN